ncbi:cytochrome c oxidase subunit 3 [Marinimicrobium sp. ABcell2]|uniref:cytochrome c oxidase subunit 3 n=1 Tax=Marinimicrobium sp. ABcell2 TaxID=3069751 RepID=UPI0027AEDC76|nr:cytochrome c oxidase subunit 3 [Marinimicrobium sp. ABcell2]MDQ2078485.1 cytochrome c oxidase subunit 3 [Marinimicrobium sp. ABcell2]
MNLWGRLTEKPWLAAPGGVPVAAEPPATDFASKRIALYFFLAVATVFFSLLVITFLTHSQFPGFQALAGEPWQPFTDTTRLWFNTSLLLLSSLAMQIALMASRAARPKLCLLALVGAIFFALQFLLAQLWLWQQLSDMGYGVRANPSSSYFYLLTALHGLHLVAGLVVLVKPLMGFWKGKSLDLIGGSVKLCTTYWHYLLVVWVLMFGLLASSEETYRTLAALCGL